MGTSTASRFIVSDVSEVLEASGMFRRDRSGSIRAISSIDGWTEGALRVGADGRLHVVLSLPPGLDSSIAVGDAEVRLELSVDPELGAVRIARMILASAGLDPEGLEEIARS